MSDGAVTNPGASHSNQPQIEKYLKRNQARVIREWRRFANGSGSAEQDALSARNFTVQRWTMPDGAVALFAESPYKEGVPTILFYNHFARTPGRRASLVKRDGQVVGPGSVGGGTFAARLMALDSLTANGAELPMNVKWLVEGQEGQINSHLAGLLQEHAGELKADACLWAGGGFTPDGRALISLGSKGILAVRLSSRTMSKNADSALAGVLPNAAWRIAWALNSIKGDTEEIRVSGFGDENDEDLFIPGEDLSLLLGSVRDHKTRLAERLKEFELSAYLMELRDPQVLLTEFFTPTANISGFEAGLPNGTDTTVPATASAKLDFRLVPNQEPDKVLKLLKEHLKYKDLEDVEVEQLGLALKPARTSPGHPFAKLVLECVTETSSLPPLLIPLSPDAEPVAFFKDALGDLPVVGLGVEHAGANRGEKTENVRLSDFAAHVRAVSRLLERMAETQSDLDLPEPLEAFSFSED